MTRCAIYARFSTDMQSDTSAEDQIRECREYAQRKGWEVVAVYSDHALSGGSFQRPEFQEMLSAAHGGQFDIILAEALDRFSRRLSDTAKVFDELEFKRVQIHTKDEGEITKMHVALMGLMAEQFVTNLREKTKRGQRGRFLQGKTPGGLGYGYRVSGLGERSVIPEEAEIIRRIFSQYVSGMSPRSIAQGLNADGIPGPKGREWKDTTIRGQQDRGTGILNNHAYIGKLTFGKTQYQTDPTNRKRVARPQPKDQWEFVEVPDLRIVDDELWEGVKNQQSVVATVMPRDGDGNPLNRLHRKKHLLSGLIRCGECGGRMSIVARDRYGCSSYRTSRTCKNSRTITRQEVENRVLAGLKSYLLDAELVGEFLESYQREMSEAREQANRSAHMRQKRSAELDRQIERLVDAIADGTSPANINNRLAKLEAEKLELSQQDETASQDIVPLPNLHQMYKDRVASLMSSVTAPDIRAEAIGLIQSMIDSIVITPLPDGDGFDIELSGELSTILNIVDQKSKNPGTGVSGHSLSVVAGARLHRGSTNEKRPVRGGTGRSLSVVAGVGFEPTTFRL